MAYRGPNPIPVISGGTGAITLTGVVTGNGTSALTANTVTQYGTVVAGASNSVSSIAPSATSGIAYISQGASSNPTFGAVSPAGGGTGSTTYTNGQLLIGNTTGNTLAVNTLTGTSNQVNVTNGAGSITLSLPQSIATTSTPTFGGLTCSTTAGDVSINITNTSASDGDDALLTITSKQDCILTIEADSDNTGGEDDNPYLIFSQDGGSTTGTIQLEGTAGQSYSGTAANALLISSSSSNPVQLITVGVVRVTVGSINFIVLLNLSLQTLGTGIYIAEGVNATSGVATLVSGTVTVSTTAVTATSRIHLTANSNSGTEYGFVKVSARSAGTSFTITSYRGGNSTTVASGDTSTVAWLIIEPA